MSLGVRRPVARAITGCLLWAFDPRPAVAALEVTTVEIGVAPEVVSSARPIIAVADVRPRERAAPFREDWIGRGAERRLLVGWRAANGTYLLLAHGETPEPVAPAFPDMEDFVSYPDASVGCAGAWDANGLTLVRVREPN